MRITLEELAMLYNKMLDGSATPDDVFEFQLTIATAHMKKEALIPIMEKKAAELRQTKAKGEGKAYNHGPAGL